MAIDPAIRDHQTWLGYLQPDGLVVSPAAMVDAQVVLDTHATPLQQKFLTFVEEIEHNDAKTNAIRNLYAFLHGFLEWPDNHLIGISPEQEVPEALKVPVREFGETLEPDIVFRDPKPEDADHPWLVLIQEIPLGTDLDTPVESAMAGWAASHSRRLERLLREVKVPIGLITNRTHLRLIYAPRGENAGTLTFRVSDMTEVAGRPILAALHMLLCHYRLSAAAASEERLPALLKRSRDYQSRVSTALSAQVLDALYELLRGFQAANEHAHGDLLRDVLAKHPDQVYNGLLTVLMRLVFLLYAEDRGLMPGSDLYVRNYAIHGLFERLRSDAQHYPDTMDHRYGAWAQLVALFRVVHDGCEHKLMKMPRRHGHLFDPDRFPFLEGRTTPEARLPLVSDGVVHRVLAKLLLLSGERLSYRTLDVEQIGSVYETMMGFRLELANGQTIALKPAKAHGAPVPLNLDELLAASSASRAKWIAARTDYKLTATMNKAVKAADNVDGLLAALERRIARNATPQPAPAGTMVLMPTDERRKTGSHYTPRSLTEPIVRTTLEPILKQLAENPTPDQILNLKVCDPAMGSGAFLVEACRQLADELVKAWVSHGWKPVIPSDEDEVLHARRIIAQRCLYGVDRNPMAVDLAKLSLWLTTLARDHPFTFLDHSLRSGDSLVGLTQKQIAGFHWAPSDQQTFLEALIRQRMRDVGRERKQILESGDQMPPGAKRQKLAIANEALEPIRLIGNAIVAAFFSGSKARQRNDKRDELLIHVEALHVHRDIQAVVPLQNAVRALRSGDYPVTPFHWEIEFPEVFTGENGGFDAIVGNPPFAGKNTLAQSNRDGYLDWLKAIHEKSHGNSDLVAHFFRRAFGLVRQDGCFGLIATNTIGQGDTRATGLRYICTHGGTIYSARRRHKWPGEAAVIVSVVHVMRGDHAGRCFLDGRQVPLVTAYLFHTGGHSDPERLYANKQKAFIGAYVLGMGFTFDDSDTSGTASPVAEMKRLVEEEAKYAEVIFPYIGGEEINSDPHQRHHRYVINFDNWPLRRADLGKSWFCASEEVREGWLRKHVVPMDYPRRVVSDFPDLLAIVEEKVKPARMGQGSIVNPERWWMFARPAADLYEVVAGSDKVLAMSRIGNYCAMTFLPANMVYSEATVVFAYETYNAFGLLQSRIHEIWARFLASSMKDDLRYAPSDCFETFPLPTDFEAERILEHAGVEYYENRAKIMVDKDEGLTKTYNRFHDPNETSPDILRLRKLHDAMDRAVLEAYGWNDIETASGFGLDHLDVEDENLPDDVPEQLWWPTAAEAASFEASLPATRRRRPWRCRWADDVHDEVLARLLALNAERAEEERRTGQAAANAKKKTTKRRRKKKVSGEEDTPMFK